MRDEGLLYAQRLEAAGNQVQIKEYPGACHDHMIVALDAPSLGVEIQCGMDALKDLCEALKQLFKC